MGATQPLQLSFAFLSPLDDKWVWPLNILLGAGLVGQSGGRLVQGDAACAEEGLPRGLPMSARCLAGIARDDKQSNRGDVL